MNSYIELSKKASAFMSKSPYYKMFVGILIAAGAWLAFCGVGYLVGQMLYYVTH